MKLKTNKLKSVYSIMVYLNINKIVKYKIQIGSENRMMSITDNCMREYDYVYRL